MNNQPIGILDSGIGGLSIWRETVKQLPHESTIYIADSKNCPYGVRSADEIYSLGKQLVQFLVNKKVKLIVIACNTVTVTSLVKLRHDFPELPIVGVVPVIKTAAASTKTKKIAILSTSATAKSLYQKNLIREFAQDKEVKCIGIDKLVPFVEKGELTGKKVEAVLIRILRPLVKHKFDVFVLGCSHFPFLKSSIQRIVGKKVLLLDSAGAIARQVNRVLTRNNALAKEKSRHDLFTTGDKETFAAVVQKVIGDTIPVNISHVRL